MGRDDVFIMKIDCTASPSPKACEDKRLPVLMFYDDGKPEEYMGDRNTQKFVEFI